MRVLDLFRSWKNIESLDTGAVVFSHSDPAESLYVVLDGEVELTVRGAVLATESKGSIIGEMAMLDSAPNNARAVVTKPARLARIAKAEIPGLISRSPEFSMQLMMVLANRLRNLDQYIGNKAEPDKPTSEGP
jgi:CRP-like cAMP-binding protein